MPEESTETRLKRLRFRSWHRGFKEADFVIGYFADAHLQTLTPEELDQYEALIGVEDRDLWEWITEKTPTPPEHDHGVMDRIKSFRHLAGVTYATQGDSPPRF